MPLAKKEINWDDFDKLCAMQATKVEICAFLGVEETTLLRFVKKKFGAPFTVIYAQKASKGKISLRRAIWKKAITDEDTKMQIWLSKNHLGMSDKREDTIRQEKPAEVKIVWEAKQNGPRENHYDRNPAEPVQEIESQEG